jgi:hypothetical protein
MHAAIVLRTTHMRDASINGKTQVPIQMFLSGDLKHVHCATQLNTYVHVC